MKMYRQSARAVVAVALVLAGTGVLSPRDAAAQSTLTDEWKFRAIPYFWGANITTRATFPGGNSTDVYLSLKDLLNHLRFAGMGSLEAQKGAWGAFTDVVYMDVGGAKATTRDGTIDGVPLPVGATLNTGARIKAWVWTLAGSYRVQSTPDLEMDVFAGARLLSLQPTLDYSFNIDVGPFSGPGRGGSRTVKANDWDGIVGVKGRVAVGSSREWFIPYYVDIGTGDSDLTWQASAGVGYKFSWGDLILTYRYLDYNFKSSSKIDSMTMKGPLLGAAFSW